MREGNMLRGSKQRKLFDYRNKEYKVHCQGENIPFSIDVKGGEYKKGGEL
jgi:hypothetical protein